MDVEGKQDFTRRKARENQIAPDGEEILWSRHAITELVNEGWTRAVAEEGLQSCEVIEDYPASLRPLPDCLVLGWLAAGEPFHAVAATDRVKDRVLIITVYRPSSEEWQDDWRVRKR